MSMWNIYLLKHGKTIIMDKVIYLLKYGKTIITNKVIYLLKHGKRILMNKVIYLLKHGYLFTKTIIMNGNTISYKVIY